MNTLRETISQQSVNNCPLSKASRFLNKLASVIKLPYFPFKGIDTVVFITL